MEGRGDQAPVGEAGAGERTGATAPAPRPAEETGLARWSFRWVWVVIAVGALFTAGLAIVSGELAAANEQHLLKLRSKEVAAVFTGALPDIETPLGAAAALANLTGADPAKFTQFAKSYVGAKGQFISMSVWRTGHFQHGPVIVAGSPPELPEAPGGALPVLRAASHRTATHSALTVRGLLQATQRRVAYVYAGSSTGRFLVEAESALPHDTYTRTPRGSAYSNINVAVYIGTRATPDRLVLRTVHRTPLPGAHATTTIPFGSNHLTVVISARQPLGGSLPEQMPWFVAILGALITAGAAVLTFRLVSGGRRAEALAVENRRLYGEQREIAQSLQHALLPDAAPEVEGLELAAVYDAGAPGVDIGGDWYDMIRLSSRRLLLVVGDISGRGIRAAAAMATLRSAIQYAAQVDPPEDFLPTLSGLRSLRNEGQLATVLCVMIDLQEQRVDITSAGHLPPLLVHDGESRFLETEVGLPIGVDTDSQYATSSFDIPDGASLLAFTDGLIERHGESLDVGLERLRRAGERAPSDIEQMMTWILDEVRGPNSVDDTAIAGVKWAKRTNH